MYTAQEVIKDKFWIVNEVHGKVGTLRCLPDGSYEFFDQRTNEKQILAALDSLFSMVDRDTETSEDVIKFIKGYPTATNNPVEVEHDTLPLYVKTPTSKSVMAAGYYILKFSGMGWQYAFCPKYETLEKYPYKGPWATEWEMNLQLKRYKNSS
jgi:hypothetical protein